MRYTAHIVWNERDEIYFAGVSELPWCIAQGKTRREAMANLGRMVDQWIELAADEGRKVPAPVTVEKTPPGPGWRFESSWEFGFGERLTHMITLPVSRYSL